MSKSVRWSAAGFDELGKSAIFVKIEANKRKSIAQTLAKLKASQRATAGALGVSKTTVHDDLENGQNRPQSEPSQMNEPPPTANLSGNAVAEAAKKAARKDKAASPSAESHGLKIHNISQHNF
jgi:predicted transcriptional regulator